MRIAYGLTLLSHLGSFCFTLGAHRFRLVGELEVDRFYLSLLIRGQFQLLRQSFGADLGAFLWGLALLVLCLCGNGHTGQHSDDHQLLHGSCGFVRI